MSPRGQTRANTVHLMQASPRAFAHPTAARPAQLERSESEQRTRENRTLHHRLFELLRRSEGDLFAGLDMDSFAGRRIASFTGRALSHHQDAKPPDPDAVALLQVLGDQADQIAEHGFGLLLR